jgi:hypothetical protein
MKKVLIVSYFFPPKNMLASKRYGIMCKYMNNFGWDPYVITLESIGDLPIPLKKDHIIRIGNEVNIGNGQLTVLQVLVLWLSKIIKLSFRSMGRNDFVWMNMVKKERKRIKEICPDPNIIIGTFPPIGNVIVARYLAKQYKVPWIAEIRDLISQYKDDVPKGWRKSVKLDLSMEKYLLSTASGIVPVTAGFRKQLRQYYNKKFAVVFNGWDTKDKYNNVETDLPEEYLYYAGSLYEHRMSSMYLLLDALKDIPKSNNIKLLIRIVNSPKSVSEIDHYIKISDLTERVIIRKACKEDIVRDESSKATINIVLSDMDESKPYLLATIPGKIMELIGEKPPILAVVSPKAELADILLKTNKGIATCNKEEITRFILNEHYNYVGDSKQIKKFSRTNQTYKLCKYLDSIVR